MGAALGGIVPPVEPDFLRVHEGQSAKYLRALRSQVPKELSCSFFLGLKLSLDIRGT